MSLTNVKIKAIKATGKIFKLYDSNGLYLHVSKKFTDKKGRVWRYKYKFNNKEKSLTIGSYPTIGLKKARELRNEAYMKLSTGVDPAQQKQNKKLEALKKQNTGKSFREVALSWIEFKLKPNTKRNWKPDTAKKTIRSLENGVFPVFGDKKIHLLNSDDIDEAITPIQERGALEVANRTLKRIDSVFRYGIYKKWCKENPALGRDEFLERHKVKHMSYIKEQDLPVFLRDLESYKGNFVCKSAVELVLLTYVKTKEIRFATWDEIDFDNKQWHIPAERKAKDKGASQPRKLRQRRYYHYLIME